ncbi:unnamed protein product [Sphagnum tenellum]
MAAALGRRAVSLCRSVRSASAEGAVLRSTFYRSFIAAGKTSGDGDDVVKAAFVNQQQKFRAFLEELSKTKLEVDPGSEASVKKYYDTMAKIRGSIGVPSFTKKISNLLEAAAEEAPDVRSILEIQRSLRREVGIEDDIGADELTFAALDKVEKSIGKRLVKDDANGMSLWKKELDQINQKLGLSPDSLEQLEEEAEHALAKAELEDLKNTAVENIETYKRRDELNVDVDPKELDYRAYL